MKWWNDLWLNEGFASFVEDVGVDHLFPAWKMMDQFVSTKVFRSLSLDQMSNSHPIQVEVHDPAQINAIFDTISYNKVNKMEIVLHASFAIFARCTCVSSLDLYSQLWNFHPMRQLCEFLFFYLSRELPSSIC